MRLRDFVLGLIGLCGADAPVRVRPPSRDNLVEQNHA